MTKTKIHFLALLIALLLLLGTVIPIIEAVNNSNNDFQKGFDKGLSYKNVIPIEKVTFINYDNETYLDDYAYLSAVPSAVFEENDILYSYPLLFFQEEHKYEDDKERSLNAFQGLHYFMEDWMQYCNYNLDQMTLVNVDKNKIPSDWNADNYNIIKNNNPYDLAKDIALHDWSYSDDAVVAVIEENFKKSDHLYKGEIEGKIDNIEIKKIDPYYTNQLDKLNPRQHNFEVPSGYKFLSARTWYSSVWIGSPPRSDLPLSLNITIPAADPDSQFFCKHENGEWMQVAVTQAWNIDQGMDKEKAQTYIYNDGPWYFTITDVPTFGESWGSFGKPIDILRNMFTGARYQTDITLYPGVDKIIEESPPFGCRNATFKLLCDKDVKLGFSVLGPSGEEIVTSVGKNLKVDIGDTYTLHIDQLGECVEGENYKICVYLLEEVSGPVNFKVEYSWNQNISKPEGNALASATEGAVLASTLNSPLLYTGSSFLPEATKDALYKLGVKNIYLINIGNHINSDTKKQIKDISKIVGEYTELTQIYDKIMKNTGENDIIFSTIDPWTRWLVTECKPHDETKAALFIGPAAYCAAHHGSPVIIVDMHPELSSNVVWHTEFWKRSAKGHPHPSVACMHLTVSKIIDFLKDIGLDQQGIESMVTIADQYEIGAPWDRAFVGVTNPGRIYGSPVDTSYWISRNVFYPALIFNNPAMDPNGVKLEQGSYSERRKLFPIGYNGLKIVKGNKEEIFKYPVLSFFITYAHRLNEAFGKYYHMQYKCADDIIPGLDASYEPIDQDVVPGKEDQMIWPDLSGSEVTPFYLSKGGYENVFSTNFDVMTENLNKGVLMFISSSHGTGADSGVMISWNPDNSGLNTLFRGLNLFGYQKETNPWRGYDWLMGSTENPDTMTMEVHGFIPALLGNPNIDGLFPTGEDFWPSERPLLHSIGKILKIIPIVKWFVPDWLTDSSYYKDGMIGAHTISGFSIANNEWTGYNWDDKLTNLHSCGWLNGACLPAYKLLHLTMVRHGSVFQIIDPWPTSWYMYWVQTIPRDIVLGDTMGEAYRKGVSHVGILYATDPPQWWWDIDQNIVYFGDPDLRVFVPGTEYSDKNYWTSEETKSMMYENGKSINGHTPFGATSYPHAHEPKTWIEEHIFLLILLTIIVVLLIAISLMGKKIKN